MALKVGCMQYDYVILGGGIVGVSTAWQLKQREPEADILLIEKEQKLAQHQTGHNSGVIHAGVYYAPGSLKAQFCREGVEATKSFCAKHDIPVENCGKLLVATTPLEVTRMEALFERCQTNGIDVEMLNQEELKVREPNITGLGAIYVSTTSIVSYTQVCNAMAEEFTAMGGEIRYGSAVTALDENAERVEVEINQKERIQSSFLIACCGLMADRVATLMDLPVEFQIVPFRGEYYRLAPKHNQVVNHLIYPIPDPDLPFLGVHLTRMIDGSVTVGPNAVQGWKREGYGKLNFSVKDTLEMVQFSGFWRVLAKHFKTGLAETRNSWWKPGYLKLVNKYCPSIELDDLEPYPAGIRAQAVLKDGTLVHDFLFIESKRSLHVCNAPSPAATSAIPIGNYICDKVRNLNSG
ncbi:putative Aminobutyraldehyde dehydrogenase [Vibrio nigripulchritudo SFn27]|uniref:Putative Aminobutyraldehyde dehydrogenase n=1 Tax=Vibrio nigripulchritudo TaxID=28173 RepID=U4K7F7_9VIBR|nr:putative Aminobutyraldehyde dehydrogenase [Vibrio nigripulchritudo SFn118]CCN81939.1 putative Aminobutyraldehyde dehydrogenase [Vibrio nigripulchritudo BLFn1]CCN90402.1 putative Aminobutyraldehyde dehydrogenase [Vibrio nigripulchritudo SFn27]CCN93824.1 putative Aminobutyraldehyde dehydrogenase [Vibrio nigripulchritudo ENn2]CCO42852.1 putative Aminobutyraldehyde dehydrogenase [Vibrio nigripulchritudo SFn135]CCO55640.1 putative Aminobutyraldehyde dehydrogenase [Vibrio nigripulchritudo Wn13]C